MRKFTILCFAWDDWGPLWKMTQQLMHYLARRDEIRKVIFVNQDLYLVRILETFKDEFMRGENRHRWQNAFLQKIEHPEEKVAVYTPMHYCPFSHRNGLFKEIDRKVFLKSLDRVVRREREGKLILFINRKIPSWLIDYFDDALIRCFYWTDDWSSFPMGGKKISEIMMQEKQESERQVLEILKRSDMVLATSEALREKAAGIVPESHWLPNGTNYENFARAKLPETEIPAGLKKVPKPIIGLVGFITSSIDFDLLKFAASNRPDWSFVLIGPWLPAAKWGADFFDLRNVYYLGAKPYFELAQYIKAFDVCMIPYVNHESLRMADSNKLYDYLATGKPIVVSQRTAGVGRFAHLIKISTDKADFLRQLEESLHEDDAVLVKQRQETARLNSWEKRAEEIWLKISEKVDP